MTKKNIKQKVADLLDEGGPRIRCTSCKDIIRSSHRHDFVWCKCGAIAVDGGSDYTRITGNAWEFVK